MTDGKKRQQLIWKGNLTYASFDKIQIVGLAKLKLK